MKNDSEQTDNHRQYEHKLLSPERLASISQFAAEVAHEINNPLDGMIEVVRYLEQIADEPEKVRKYMPLIRQGLERIERIVRQLISFSCNDASNYREVFDVRRVINDTILLLDGSMKKRGVVIKVGCKTRCLAVGNAAATSQAVTNLLLNAADAMSMRGGKINLDISSVNGEVLISVEDKGPGISEKISEQIFKPFFSTKREGPESLAPALGKSAMNGGTGLGLAVSRNLIRKCGGELALAERKTKTGGAKFEIRLIGHNQRKKHNGSQSQIVNYR